MKDNQIYQPKSQVANWLNWANDVQGRLAVIMPHRTRIKVTDNGVDTDLPVYRLPDSNGVYIGFNPPKPHNFGYGVRHG